MSERGVTPPLVAFGLLSFFYFATIGLFNPYAPLWFKELGFSTIVIGLIASLQSWTRVVAPYAWSWFGDHTGRHVQLIRIAAAASLVFAAGLLAAREVAWVALATGLLFVANSGVVPLSETAVANHLSRGQGIDAVRYGRMRMWGSVGFILSVTLVGALLQVAGMALFPVVLVLVYALLLWASTRLPEARSPVAHDAPPPPVWPLLRRPEVAWFFASVFFVVLAHAGLYAFFSLYLVSLGYGKAAVGALWAVSVAAEIVYFWFHGRWAGHLAPLRWLQVVALVTAARFAATAGAGHWPAVLVLAQISHAITFAAHHSTCITLLHRYFPGRSRGRGQALYSTLGYGLSGVLGGVCGGLIIDRLGFAAVFWAASAAALAGWWCARKALHSPSSPVPG
jgi:PPP family 3-phenylpropionic acid transporter